MTIEEVIKIAKGLRTDFKCESDTMVDFCNTIIKALDQQPCEDCISRQAVLDSFWKLDTELRPSAIDAIVNMINNLPSVTPKEKSEYEHNHEVVKAYNNGQAYILDKIRTEIEDIPNNPSTKPVGTYDYVMGATNERRIILEIIDKYRGE